MKFKLYMTHFQVYTLLAVDIINFGKELVLHENNSKP